MRGPGGLPGGERTEGGAQGWPGSRAALPTPGLGSSVPHGKTPGGMGSAFLRSVYGKRLPEIRESFLPIIKAGRGGLWEGRSCSQLVRAQCPRLPTGTGVPPSEPVTCKNALTAGRDYTLSGILDTPLVLENCWYQKEFLK